MSRVWGSEAGQAVQYMYVLLQASNRGRLGFYAKNKILFGTV